MLYHWANRWLVHSGLYYAGIFERVSFVQCFTTATGLDNSWFTDDRINAARRLKFIIYLWYSFFSILGHFCTWYFESARVVVICELTRCGYAKSLIPWLVYLFRIPIVFPLETFEIVPIFHFWGIPRWYHFAVYSSSVGLSWFVNLPRLALLRIELRTLGLPVGCSTIELIVDLYTVDSFYAGIFERVSFVQCFTTATGLDNS